jgi:hypothetical protein
MYQNFNNYRGSRGRGNPVRRSVGIPSYEAVDNYREEIYNPRPPQNRGRGKPTASRRYYNESRGEGYRDKQSTSNARELGEQLKKVLQPGVDNVLSRLDAASNIRAITLPVTTRSMGFGSFLIMHILQEYERTPVLGNVYQLYRVTLLLFNAKVQALQHGITMAQRHLEDFAEADGLTADYMQFAKSITNMPDFITRPLNVLGQVKVYDAVYVPRIGIDVNTNDDLFIPVPEQVTYLNLRDTVVALANVETPAIYRRRFYEANPIPGAIWRGQPNNPLLQNADEIMPANYGLQNLKDDYYELRRKLQFLNDKAAKYFTKTVDFGDIGNKAMLVCNESGNLRCPDRNEGEDLIVYYPRTTLRGDVNEFWNLQVLTGSEQSDGILSLLGEYPTTRALRYAAYSRRNPTIELQYCGISYNCVRNVTYT